MTEQPLFTAAELDALARQLTLAYRAYIAEHPPDDFESDANFVDYCKFQAMASQADHGWRLMPEGADL